MRRGRSALRDGAGCLRASSGCDVRCASCPRPDPFLLARACQPGVVSANGPRFRCHHCGRRIGRLRHREPALGAFRHECSSSRGGARHAAGSGACGYPRYISLVLLQQGLHVAGAEGALAHPAQLARDRIRSGTHHRRRLVRDGHGRAARHPGRLRRVGPDRCARVGVAGCAALFPQARERLGFRRRTAWPRGAHSRAPHALRTMDTAGTGCTPVRRARGRCRSSPT